MLVCSTVQGVIMLTYRELKLLLDRLSDAQLDTNVTVYDRQSDEYHAVRVAEFSTDECNILDPGHLVLVTGRERD